MKPILLTTFIFLSQFLSAQTDYLGLRGGLNWSNVKTDTPFEDSDGTTGFLGGITYQHQFENGFYWGVDLLYSERGFEDELFPGSIDPCLNCLRVAEPVVHQLQYNYISMPIKVGITFGGAIKFFTDLALVPSTLIRARAHSIAFNTEIPEVDEFDLATQIEAGATFRLYERWIAFGSVSYLSSITSITNANYFPDNKMQHRTVNLSFGIRYEIKKR